MKTVIDLTEDDNPGGGDAFPDPSSISLEDGNDTVLVQLREVELLVTFVQLLELHQAMGRFIFRDCRGEVGIGDPDYYPHEEYEKLRALIRQMIDVGTVGHAEVAEDLQLALRADLARTKVAPRDWRDAQESLRIARAQNADLREENAFLKSRKGATRKAKAMQAAEVAASSPEALVRKMATECGDGSQMSGSQMLRWLEEHFEGAYVSPEEATAGAGEKA